MTIVTPQGHGLGCEPDEPDSRDFTYDPSRELLDGSVASTGGVLASEQPSIWDQLTIGSCTAHGSLRAFCVALTQLGIPLPPAPAGGAPFSRLEQYWNSRALEGTTSTDSGAQVRDAIKALAQDGVAPETAWQYDVSKFAVNPGQAVETAGRVNVPITYHRLVIGGPGAPMRTALLNKKLIVIGFNVPSYFEDGTWDPSSGEPLPIPPAGYNDWLGGHCVALNYFNFSRVFVSGPFYQGQRGNFFTAANSWNSSWGMEGFFNMDSEWFNPSRGLAQDFWVIDSAQ